MRLFHPWTKSMRPLTRSGLVYLFVVQMSLSAFAQVDLITTVAGNGTQGFSGDGGLATSAELSAPQRIAVDLSGNLFIADFDVNRIRKVTPTGIISTVAGNGTMGYGGDGGSATSAMLSLPRDVAVDSAGNLFIADTGRSRIRKVTPDGIISTVAGSGNAGYSGDGGPATSAQIKNPDGVAVDSEGNLFIADSGNYRIRKVTPDGIIRTVAGNGNQGFSGDGGSAATAGFDPIGVALDSEGNLFIADSNNGRVRKVTLDGIISTVAGNGCVPQSGIGGYSDKCFHGDGGPATSVSLPFLKGIALDSGGNLFIADSYFSRIRKVTPDGVISTIAGGGGCCAVGDGGPATSAQLTYPHGVAVDSEGNLFIADTQNMRIRKVTRISVQMNLTLNTGGSATSRTAGLNKTTQAGYATVAINSGVAPYGTAVFSFKQNGVTVTETGVPASPPTTAARIYIDYRSSVDAIPARSGAGIVDINTGIAAVNAGPDSAAITYTLRNTAGATLATGHGILAAGAHFAKFIDQMNEVAPDFVLPANFETATQFASLEISSAQPLSILALRMTTNQRKEALFTTTPVADLIKPLGNSPMLFPQFADGGGYATSIILLNTSNVTETGTIQLRDDNGNPITVTSADGGSASIFSYSIPVGGAFRFQTDGFPATAKTGWVQVTPDADAATPAGAAVFSYNPEDILITESGVPATDATTYARIYVDLSGSHNTGLAVVNPTSTHATITMTAFQSDGVTGIGSNHDPLQLSGQGHSAHFVNEFIAGLPAEFRGVLDIFSSTPFAALTLRSLYNERNDFLLATFPVADMTKIAPSPIVFPHIADGGGYATEFILISPGGASSTTLNYFSENGTPLALMK
jgi:sugar lactone lactonase YvrE